MLEQGVLVSGDSESENFGFVAVLVSKPLFYQVCLYSASVLLLSTSTVLYHKGIVLISPLIFVKLFQVLGCKFESKVEVFGIGQGSETCSYSPCRARVLWQWEGSNLCRRRGRQPGPFAHPPWTWAGSICPTHWCRSLVHLTSVD